MVTSSRRFWPPRVLVIGSVVLVLALAVGLYAGLRTPWGTKHPRVEQGIAMRANSDNDLVLFDSQDGTQLALYADGLWWETDNTGGTGDPPCLRTPLEKAEVEVGYLLVAGPTGGARPEALWVKCL